MLYSTNAFIEISVDGNLTPKQLHLLRQRLKENFEEVIHDTLAEFDISNQLERAVSLENIEAEGEIE